MTPNAASAARFRQRLRAAKTESDARAVMESMSPEAIVGAVAKTLREESAATTPPPTRWLYYFAEHPALVGVVMNSMSIFAMALLQLGRFLPVAFDPLAILLTILVLVVALGMSTRAIRSRRHSECRFSAPWVEAIHRVRATSAAPDILVLFGSGYYGDAVSPIREALRATLLRLLPRVTAGDAAAFDTDSIRVLHKLATNRLSPFCTISDADELRAAAWLTLATLAGDGKIPPELVATMRADATTNGSASIWTKPMHLSSSDTTRLDEAAGEFLRLTGTVGGSTS